jgi:hypothetical protein
MKYHGHTYGGFVPAISEWGMTPPPHPTLLRRGSWDNMAPNTSTFALQLMERLNPTAKIGPQKVHAYYPLLM